MLEQVSFPTKINKGSYHSKLGITRRGIESITSLLIEEQLCKRTRAGYKHPKNASKSRSAQYFPTPKLIKIGVEFLYEQIGDFDDYSPYEFKSEIHWDNSASNRHKRAQKFPIAETLRQQLRERLFSSPYLFLYSAPAYLNCKSEKKTKSKLKVSAQSKNGAGLAGDSRW